MHFFATNIVTKFMYVKITLLTLSEFLFSFVLVKTIQSKYLVYTRHYDFSFDVHQIKVGQPTPFSKIKHLTRKTIHSMSLQPPVSRHGENYKGNEITQHSLLSLFFPIQRQHHRSCPYSHHP